MSDPGNLRADWRHYDQRVDIVSSVEVWFTKVDAMIQTVTHFERFPTLPHPLAEGETVTPDFTVLFDDSTGYVGELADLALHDGSLDSLCQQLMRYDVLTELQAAPTAAGGRRAYQKVVAIDHLLFVRHADAASANERLRDALADPDHFFSLSHPLVVLSWSFDAERSKYAFVRDERRENPRPRGHNRPTSLEGWMASPKCCDTLTGLPKHFEPIKVRRRLMNDQPPPIYLSALVWQVILSNLSGGEGDVDLTVADLAQALQDTWGKGSVRDAERVLRLYVDANLAAETPAGFTVGHRALDERGGDLVDQLVQRLQKKVRGPATLQGKRELRERRQERQQILANQTRLPLDPSSLLPEACP